MFEHYSCLEELKDILTLPIDAILIGPYDLSASLGHPGDFNNPAYISTLNSFIEICKSSVVPIGFHQVNPSPLKLRSLIDQGFTFLAYGIDTIFITESVDSLHSNVSKFHCHYSCSSWQFKVSW